MTARSESPPAQQPATSLHLGFIDGLRGLAALYVLLYHAKLVEFWESRTPSPAVSLATGWLNFGHLAVDVFIVVSGFCLMLPALRANGRLLGGVKTFFWRRVQRILPPYYAALALSILLGMTLIRSKTGTVWDYSLPVTKAGILFHVILLQNIHRSMEINSVFWSIAVEFQIYLLFPAMLLLYARYGMPRSVLGILVGAICGAVLSEHTRFVGLTFHYVGLFAVGNLAAAIAISPQEGWDRWRRMNWPVILSVFSLVIAASCTALGAAGVDAHMIPVDVLVGLWTAVLLVTIARKHDSALCCALSWRPLSRMGTFSYSIYLIHMPLLQLIWQYGLERLHLGRTATYLCLSLPGAALIVGAAYIFYLLFERPFIRKPKKVS